MRFNFDNIIEQLLKDHKMSGCHPTNVSPLVEQMQKLEERIKELEKPKLVKIVDIHEAIKAFRDGKSIRRVAWKTWLDKRVGKMFGSNNLECDDWIILD